MLWLHPFRASESSAPAIVQEINKEENILASLKDQKSYSLSYFPLAKTSHMDTQRWKGGEDAQFQAIRQPSKNFT